MRRKPLDKLDDDQAFKRWCDDIDTCGTDVLFLTRNRAKFRSLETMFDQNALLDHSGKAFGQWIVRLWGTESLMAIRRDLDDQGGVVNLRTLLREMESRPRVLTRRRHLEARESYIEPDHTRKQGNQFFERFGFIVGGPRHSPNPLNDYIDPAAIRKDRLRLESRAKPAYDYAQRLVAHRTPHDHLELTFDAIDQGIDAIKVTLQKYVRLLHADTMSGIDFEKLPDGWHGIFRVPWIIPRDTRS